MDKTCRQSFKEKKYLRIREKVEKTGQVKAARLVDGRMAG